MEDSPQTLSSIYYFLFSKTGTVGYLHDAIDKGYQAAAATPLVHPERAIRLHTLAANLYQRFAQTGADDGIQQAILIAEEAVTSLPNDHEERAP
jgi:hypothetical protein